MEFNLFFSGRTPDKFKEYAEYLENEIKNIKEDAEDPYEICGLISKKLNSTNCENFVEGLFDKFNETKNKEYLEIFSYFVEMLKNCCEDSKLITTMFCKYIEDIPERIIFGNYNYETKSALSNITNYIQFNNKKYSIEEFIDLSKQVKEINRHLIEAMAMVNSKSNGDLEGYDIEALSIEFNEMIDM